MLALHAAAPDYPVGRTVHSSLAELEEMRMGADLCRIVHRSPGQLRGMP